MHENATFNTGAEITKSLPLHSKENVTRGSYLKETGELKLYFKMGTGNSSGTSVTPATHSKQHSKEHEMCGYKSLPSGD